MTTLALGLGILLAALIICSAFLSSAEVAVFSLTSLHLKNLEASHPHAASHLRRIIANPTRFLSVILIGNTAVNVTTAFVGYALCEQLFTKWTEEIAVIGITSLLLIFGEIGPKRVALFWPVKVATLYTPFLRLLMKVLSPLGKSLEAVTSTLEHKFVPRPAGLTDEEIESIVELSSEAGVLDEEEQEMVRGIMRLEDLQVSDLMTPRVDLLGIDLDDPPEEAEALARQAGVRYLLLFRGLKDNVEGLLDVRSYLLHPERDILSARVPLHFLPETAPADKVLKQFLKDKQRVAIVVDEYGGTAGLISRGDILEEIIGHIASDEGNEDYFFEQQAENRWLVDAGINLEELSDRLNLELVAKGSDRLAGWIIEQYENLPPVGAEIEAQGLRVRVRQKRRHRITMALVEKVTESES